MENKGYTEKDWKLYKSRIAGWQENYMDRLCKEYIELLSSETDASERFWKLDRRIREDKKKTGVIVQNSRNEMIFNILSLISEGAITEADLDGFSDELRERVGALVNMSKNMEQDFTDEMNKSIE